MRLLVSAAHTSISPGEIYKDLREFDLTKKILTMVVKHLEKSGIQFKAVPVDLQLLNRIDWINDTGYKEEEGDLFVEFHVNDGGKRGVETWYAGKADAENNAQAFATFFQDELCKVTGYENQKAKSEHEHELKSLLILNQTNTISIATELLYIDNEEDIKILKDDKKLDELAGHVVTVIKKYIDSKPKIHPKKKPANTFGGLGGDFGADPFNLPPLDLPDVGGLGGGAPAGGSSTPIMMDREQRKKMVEDTYDKVLGKPVKQADLNYYLNTGISEDDLIKKIVKSKDHEDMVKEAKEAKDIKENATKNEAELIQLRAQVTDLQRMHQQFNELLKHKNLQIKQMMDELAKNNIIRKGQYYEPGKTIQNTATNYNPPGLNSPEKKKKRGLFGR